MTGARSSLCGPSTGHPSPATSHHEGKGKNGQDAHSKPHAKSRGVIGGGGRDDRIDESTTPAFSTDCRMRASSSPSDDGDSDDDSVIVIDSTSSSSRPVGGGDVAQAKRARGGEEGTGTHGTSGKKMGESRVSSPARKKVKRGQEEEEGASHDGDTGRQRCGGNGKSMAHAGGGGSIDGNTAAALSSVPPPPPPPCNGSSASHAPPATAATFTMAKPDISVM